MTQKIPKNQNYQNSKYGVKSCLNLSYSTEIFDYSINIHDFQISKSLR